MSAIVAEVRELFADVPTVERAVTGILENLQKGRMLHSNEESAAASPSRIAVTVSAEDKSKEVSSDPSLPLAQRIE